MEQHTPTCATPTKKFPMGRTGTSAGYDAHRAVGEKSCTDCTDALAARAAAKAAGLSREEERIDFERRREARALLSEGKQRCRTCRELKKLSEYRKSSNYRNGYTNSCIPCERDRRKTYYRDNREVMMRKHQEWRKANPEYFLRRDLKRLYRISLEEYGALLRRQNNVCACCGSNEPGGRYDNDRFHVDHDHVTGAVRGLLCHKCNTGIGLLGDSTDGVMKALMYLIQSQDILTEVNTGALDRDGRRTEAEAGPPGDDPSGERGELVPNSGERGRL